MDANVYICENNVDISEDVHIKMERERRVRGRLYRIQSIVEYYEVVYFMKTNIDRDLEG